LAVQTLAPPAELELAGQAVQALDAVMPVYDPAVHAPHAAAEDPPVPVWKVPVEHDKQVEATVAPTAVENVPAPHATQVDNMVAPAAEE